MQGTFASLWPKLLERPDSVQVATLAMGLIVPMSTTVNPYTGGGQLIVARRSDPLNPGEVEASLVTEILHKTVRTAVGSKATEIVVCCRRMPRAAARYWK